MYVQPYLFFNGCCEQAIEFYRNAVGARVEMMMRFKESPEPPPPDQAPAGWEDKVMHASLRIGDSIVMASDGCGEDVSFKGFALALGVVEVEEAKRRFEALADGGEVTMPLTPTFWSPSFGMLTDRYGVAWMVMVVQPQQQGAKP